MPQAAMLWFCAVRNMREIGEVPYKWQSYLYCMSRLVPRVFLVSFPDPIHRRVWDETKASQLFSVKRRNQKA